MLMNRPKRHMVSEITAIKSNTVVAVSAVIVANDKMLLPLLMQ